MRVPGIDVLQARAWLHHAEQVLDLLQSDDGLDTPFAVPGDVVVSFRRCIGEWQRGLCPERGELVWDSPLRPDELQRLMTYWLNLAIRTNEAPDVEKSSGTGFYLSMVDSLLDILAKDPCTAEFADVARARWPGLGAFCAKA